MNATYTLDSSNRQARMLVRGYFDAYGQHSIRVYDRRDGCYLFPYFETDDDAVAYLARHGYTPEA